MISYIDMIFYFHILIFFKFYNIIDYFIIQNDIKVQHINFIITIFIKNSFIVMKYCNLKIQILL